MELGGAKAAGGSGITTSDRGLRTGDESIITGKSIRATRKTKRMKSRMSYMQQVKPIFDRLLGQLELALLGGMEDVADTRSENEWRTMDCPAMVRMFVNKRKVFARFVLEAASHEEAVGSLLTLHWAWDRRKTKQDTEERSLQEVVQWVFNAIQNALGDRMDDKGWTQVAKELGEAVKPLCELLDALDTEVNVAKYPRVMYDAGRQREEAAEQQKEDPEPITTAEQRNGGGEGSNKRGTRRAARDAQGGQRQHATEGGAHDKEE